jgi:hypothetical protein
MLQRTTPKVFHLRMDRNPVCGFHTRKGGRPTHHTRQNPAQGFPKRDRTLSAHLNCSKLGSRHSSPSQRPAFSGRQTWANSRSISSSSMSMTATPLLLASFKNATRPMQGQKKLAALLQLRAALSLQGQAGRKLDGKCGGNFSSLACGQPRGKKASFTRLQPPIESERRLD